MAEFFDIENKREQTLLPHMEVHCYGLIVLRPDVFRVRTQPPTFPDTPSPCRQISDGYYNAS
jgi:hypothetical protein